MKPGWGGKRAGSGRKPKNGVKAGVEHEPRPQVKKGPVQVSWEMLKGISNLQTQRCFKQIESGLFAAGDRFGMRLIHFAVLGDHVKLIVEADDSDALARGMQGLGVRLAKGVNRAMKRHGKVFADRYRARVLRTAEEFHSAVREVLAEDFSSKRYQDGEAPTVAPTGKLLQKWGA